jgi:hypothetical protein
LANFLRTATSPLYVINQNNKSETHDNSPNTNKHPRQYKPYQLIQTNSKHKPTQRNPKNHPNQRTRKNNPRTMRPHLPKKASNYSVVAQGFNPQQKHNPTNTNKHNTKLHAKTTQQTQPT